jgi:hypothetical protein
VPFLAAASGGDGTPEISFVHAPSNALSDVEASAQGSQYGDAGWTDGVFHLVTVQRSRESLTMWIDGNNMVGTWDPFSDQPDQILTDALTLTLGPAGDALAMDLAELIVVGEALHFGQRKPWEDYLAAKWFGAAFGRTPTAFGETTVWLDASRATDVTVANGAVTAWMNRGIEGGFFGNGSFPDARPVYEATGLGGHPTVRFDGSDTLLQNSVRSEDSVERGEYTVLVVLDPPAAGGSQLVFQGVNAADDDPAFRLEILADAGNVAYAHFDPATPATADAFQAPFAVASPHLLLIERRADGRITVRVDGTTSAFNGTDALDYLQTNLNWALGGYSVSDPGAGLDGAISEFIVMDNCVNAAEEEALVAALLEKWGI